MMMIMMIRMISPRSMIARTKTVVYSLSLEKVHESHETVKVWCMGVFFVNRLDAYVAN